MKCKGKTKTGQPCHLTATINGYCLMHFNKHGNRAKMLKKLNKSVGWQK